MISGFHKQWFTVLLLISLATGCGQTNGAGNGEDSATETGADSEGTDSNSDDTDSDSDGTDSDSDDTDSDSGPADTASASDEWQDSEIIEDAFTPVDRSAIGVVPFTPEAMLDYHIHMNPALLADMEANGDDEMYRPAALRVLGADLQEDFAAVGVRYKGDYSLHHCWDEHGGIRSHAGECAKLSMSIKFDEYNEDARFFGLKRLDLHAMSEDDTKLRERLAYSVFNDFGVTTSRTAHARVFINDQAPVLMLAVEHMDGRFTAWHWPEGGDGNLYKETWPSASVSEASLIHQLRTNDGPDDEPDVSMFMDFASAVVSADETSFLSAMSPFIDIEQVLRYMAVDRAFKNWDGITAFYWSDRPHNLYWYHDIETSNRLILIPWDMDKTMWRYDPYMDPVHYNGDRPVPDWNVTPSSCSPILTWYGSVSVIPCGCDNFMRLLAATSWEAFVPIGEELLDTALTYDALENKVTDWAAQIAPVVAEDPLLNATGWQAAVADFYQILENNIIDFEAHLAEGLLVEE